MRIHRFGVWSDSTCYPLDHPQVKDLLEPNAKLLQTKEWICASGKCKADMCWECICVSGQFWYDVMNYGIYNPPEKW